MTAGGVLFVLQAFLGACPHIDVMWGTTEHLTEHYALLQSPNSGFIIHRNISVIIIRNETQIKVFTSNSNVKIICCVKPGGNQLQPTCLWLKRNISHHQTQDKFFVAI